MNRWLLGCVATPQQVFREGAVEIQDHSIGYVGPAAEAPRDPRDTVRRVEGWITPGLIDLHVHGAGGRDLMEGTPEAVAQVARTLAQHGTTSFLITSVVRQDLTDNRHLEVATEAASGDLQAAQILGIHLEGPFVNPHRNGLIRSDRIWPPNADDLEAILALSRGKLRMMTLAPELPGAMGLVTRLVDHGVVGSLGHTEATLQEARAGFHRGIRHVTHLYNAMRGLHHREPGALGAVLMDHGITAQLIADGIHVHPELLRWTKTVLSLEPLVLITDALPSAGLPDGRYAFDGRPYESINGTAWSRGEGQDDRLFGTTLLLDELVRRAMGFMEVTFDEAIRMATLNPARTLGVQRRIGELAPGREANLALWDESFQVTETILRGRTIWSKEVRPL